MRSTRSSFQAAAVLGVAAVAVAAPASAATVTPNAACYVEGVSPVAATVAGATPGQSVGVQLTRKGEVLGRSPVGAVDGAGNLGLTVPVWTARLKDTGTKDVEASVEAVDTATGAVIGSATTRLAAAGFSVTGRTKTRSWKLQGLTALTGQANYYAHYENNGKYRGRLSLGKAKGPCGYLSTRKPLTPFSKLGRYDVYISTSKKLDKTAPHLRGRVTVTTTYRRR